MSFIEREINFEFTLPSGEFESGGDVVTVTGLRSEVEIDNAGGIGMSTLYAKIYGMKESDMLRCCTFAQTLNKIDKVIVRVTAGDSVSGMSQVFLGTIFEGAIDYNQTPDIPLVIQATPSFINQVDKAAPNSDPSFDVAEKISALAKSIGFEFQNSDVKGALANFYTYGSTIQQIRDIARAAEIGLDIANGMVSIWKNEPSDDVTIDISPQTGLVGYPIFQPQGRLINTTFFPDIVRGRRVNLTTTISQGSGKFYVVTVKHLISAKMPGGPWMTTAFLSTVQNRVI